MIGLTISLKIVQLHLASIFVVYLYGRELSFLVSFVNGCLLYIHVTVSSETDWFLIQNYLIVLYHITFYNIATLDSNRTAAFKNSM